MTPTTTTTHACPGLDATRPIGFLATLGLLNALTTTTSDAAGDVHAAIAFTDTGTPLLTTNLTLDALAGHLLALSQPGPDGARRLPAPLDALPAHPSPERFSPYRKATHTNPPALTWADRIHHAVDSDPDGPAATAARALTNYEAVYQRPKRDPNATQARSQLLLNNRQATLQGRHTDYALDLHRQALGPTYIIDALTNDGYRNIRTVRATKKPGTNVSGLDTYHLGISARNRNQPVHILAEWLIAYAYPSIPTEPTPTGPATTLVHPIAGTPTLIWPLWNTPLTAARTRRILTWPIPISHHPDHGLRVQATVDELAAHGINAIWASALHHVQLTETRSEPIYDHPHQLPTQHQVDHPG